MRVIVVSSALAATMALASGIGLNWSQQPIYQTQLMPSVRLGDPGSNLVGPNWSGNPPRQQRPALPTPGVAEPGTAPLRPAAGNGS